MNVDLMEILVSMGFQEKEVLRVYRALGEQESVERRAVRADQEFLEFPDRLVSMRPDSTCTAFECMKLNSDTQCNCTLVSPGTKGEPGKGVSTPGPQGVPGPRGESGRPGLQGEEH